MAQPRVEYKVIWADLEADLELDLNTLAAEGYRVVQTLAPAHVRGRFADSTTTVSGVILEREVHGDPQVY